MNEQRLTSQQALPKIKQYCSYQERCHSEVRDKLYLYGLHRNDVDTIISQLIEENYLNEQRFAIQFAGGRFRLLQWGRVKIKFALKARQVSEYCIKKALEEIDDDKYIKVLHDLVLKKWETLKSEKNNYVKKKKLQDHLLQRGFESDLVREEVAKLDK